MDRERVMARVEQLLKEKHVAKNAQQKFEDEGADE